MIEGGGGHRASAKAIISGLESLYGDEIVTSIVDVSKEHWCPLVNRMDDIYRWLTTDGLWLWKALWVTDNRPWVPQIAARLLTPFFRGTLNRIFATEKPDLVVAVHSFVNHLPLRVLRQSAGPYIPFVTVITDMVTVHPAWCCPDVDYCMVPTTAARERVLGYGMPPDRVEVVGQPVNIAFTRGLGNRSAIRRKLGWDAALPCVLLVGGGDGVGPLYETALAIASGVHSVQLAVVTGRNVGLKAQLEAVDWGIPVHIYGFVNNMPELMSASDLLVTKAGPGTIAEAFIAGLPVILFSFIPGQEEGNVKYVQAHQAGAYAQEPGEIVDVVRAWLDPENDRLKQVVANASALACPDAVLVIAERLYRILL